MQVLKTFFTCVARELYIFLRFSWRDWTATIVPGSIFAVCAARSTPDQLSFPAIISSYLLLVSWLTLYVYFFNLSNQLTGVDEDRINKPDRPIPSGQVTLAGAKRRWTIAISMFLAVAVFEPTLLPESIGWVLITGFLCLTSAGNHWFGKNCLAMPAGVCALLSASWTAIAPATPKSQQYVLALSLWAAFNAQIQDLRDVAGDAAVGRKTMPLVFGDRASRLIITFLLVPASFVVIWMGGMVSLAPLTLTVVHIYIGYRVMQAESPHYDHKTYMIYTYTFCLLLAVAAGEGFELEITQVLQRFVGKKMTSLSAM